MSQIKKLRSGVSPAKESGNSVLPAAAKAIAWKRDQENRMYVDCGPSYYDEGPASDSRYKTVRARNG